MKFTTAIAAIALVSLPAVASAQDVSRDTIIWSQPRPGDVTAPARELDALVAPVALYPDQLLSQILIASTYPLEVVEAARWANRAENRNLSGERLADMLEDRDWDPSVKALAAFPEVLDMMNSDLDWMQQVGDAFLTNEGAVMDAVQRLRHEARAAGRLVSDARQRVIEDNGYIIIEPASLDMVYVPVYDPRSAYGIWPYADYEPYYFPPPPRYVYSPWIAYSFVSVRPFWGWSRWDWGHHRIHITDIPRWRANNRGQWHADNDVWRHDPDHRRGVGRGERFRGPLNNDRSNVAINTPRPDRGGRSWDNDRSGDRNIDRNADRNTDGIRDRRPRGPVLSDNNGPTDGNAGRYGNGRFNGGGSNDSRFGNGRRVRPDVQLPDATPPLPDASPRLPATPGLPAIVSPVPSAPDFDRFNSMRGNRRGADQNGEHVDRMRGRRDLQGNGQADAAPAPRTFQPQQRFQPPVMAQSQPGTAPMQAEQPRQNFRQNFRMPGESRGQYGNMRRQDDGNGNAGAGNTGAGNDGGGNDGGGFRRHR